jgi:hypothetical protein
MFRGRLIKGLSAKFQNRMQVYFLKLSMYVEAIFLL